MMKTLLGTFFALLLTASLQAQCTPGANYADSTFGAWPDTTTNFPVGYTDFYYQTDLNFKVPNDAGDIDSAFTGSTIVNFTVDSVVGLPPGMTYACNISNCLYAGGANGCAQISGTSEATDTFHITIHITANLLIFGFPVPVPYTFEGYRIVLEDLASLTGLKQTAAALYPNPVKDILHVSGKELEAIEIYTVSGKKLLQLKYPQNEQDLSLAGFESGVYLLRMVSAEGSRNFSFVKE